MNCTNMIFTTNQAEEIVRTMSTTNCWLWSKTKDVVDAEISGIVGHKRTACQ